MFGRACFSLIWREMEKGIFYKSRKVMIFLVGRAGIEPAANGLKVRCSTSELTAHFGDYF
jgi:hypothetical protein